MFSTALIVGFVGASFLSALALFTACVMVGRVSPEYAEAKVPSRAISMQGEPIADGEWKWIDERVKTA